LGDLDVRVPSKRKEGTMKSPDAQFLESIGLFLLALPVMAVIAVLMPIYFTAHMIRIGLEEIQKANNEPNRSPWNP
jgi:hypothetical protein